MKPWTILTAFGATLAVGLVAFLLIRGQACEPVSGSRIALKQVPPAGLPRERHRSGVHDVNRDEDAGRSVAFSEAAAVEELRLPQDEASYDVLLQGNVYSRGGQAISGVQVSSMKPRVSLLTDDEGFFSFRHRSEESEWNLLFEHPEYVTKTAAGAMNRRTIDVYVEVTLESGAEFCVEVVSEDGVPIPGAEVRLWGGGANPSPEGVFIGSAEQRADLDLIAKFGGVTVASALTDSGGIACVKGLVAGGYEVSALAEGFVSASRRSVRVYEFGRVDAEPFVLSRGQTVSGYVFGRGGRPIGSALVEVFADYKYKQTLTDDAGSFSVQGVSCSARSFELRVSAKDYSDYWAGNQSFDGVERRIVLNQDRLVLVVSDGRDGSPVSGSMTVVARCPSIKGYLAPRNVPQEMVVELEGGIGHVSGVPSEARALDVRLRGFGARRILTADMSPDGSLSVQLPVYGGLEVHGLGEKPAAVTVEQIYQGGSGRELVVQEPRVELQDGSVRIDDQYFPLEAEVWIGVEFLSSHVRDRKLAKAAHSREVRRRLEFSRF